MPDPDRTFADIPKRFTPQPLKGAMKLDPTVIAELDRQQNAIEEALDCMADALECIALYFRRKGTAEGILTNEDFADEPAPDAKKN